MFNLSEAENIINILNSSNSLDYIKNWKFDKLTYSKENWKSIKDRNL